MPGMYTIRPKASDHYCSQDLPLKTTASLDLINSSEKQLARVLLLLAHFGKDGKPGTTIPKISQETRAGTPVMVVAA